jgi:hypothetical protein
MEKLTFTRACLSYVRDITPIMCVPLVKSLCQTAMGWIPALEYMLSAVRGFLWPRLISSGNKCHRFPRPQSRWSISVTESPRVGRLDAQFRPELGREVELADM